MRVGRILGVRIVLNNFFLLALLAYAWLGLLSEVLAVFGAALLHELTHMVVARAYGLRVAELELLPFGGVARIEDLDLTSLDSEVELAVALAGPVENILLAGAAWLLAGYGVWDLGVANLFFRANLGLALFNLLPGLPLDGGRVLRALLSRHLPWRQATELTARLGQAWGALLVCLGAALYRERLAALSIILLGGFLWTAATAEQRWAGLVLLRYLAHKRARLAAGAVLTCQPLVAAADTELRAVGRALAAGRYHLIWVVDKEERLQGLLSEAEFTSALLHLGPGATLGEALARRK